MRFEFGTTERGSSIVQFKDDYDNPCSAQESMVDDDDTNTPKLWLGRDDVGGRMHLTRAQVAEILPVLMHYVEHGELPQEQPTQQ